MVVAVAMEGKTRMIRPSVEALDRQVHE